MLNEVLSRSLELIDDANKKDPNTEMDETGLPQPKEFLYSKRMSKCLNEFAPEASAHLRIAARGQHIERWTSPRSAYPEGRSAYKKWRAELGLFHARRVGECMHSAGATEEDIARVQYLVQKRQLKRDPETQILEDVVCLVFLQYYLESFALKHSEEKLIDIIRKTWQKMSEHGHAAALKLAFSAPMSRLINTALQPTSQQQK